MYGGGPGSGCNPEAGKCGRPVVLYHGTRLRDVESIKKSGLKKRDPWYGRNVRKSVSLTSDRKVAHQYGFVKGDQVGKYAVLRFELPNSFARRLVRDQEEKSSWLSHEDIPARYLANVRVHSTHVSKKQYQRLWKEK
jgi:RNA:NAD 2'-phosphotransferase (TPT1/KptA family)